MSERVFIRFGGLPKGGRSKIWRGEEVVGEEKGVSVYDAVVRDDGISVCLPFPLKRDTLDTFTGLVAYQNRHVYLVKGDVVGKGNDGEPIIENVEIIKRIK